MKEPHAELDEWLDTLRQARDSSLDEWLDSYISKYPPDKSPKSLNRQLFRCLSWYDITSGNTLDEMNPENINSVELIVLKKIFDLLTEDGFKNGF